MTNEWIMYLIGLVTGIVITISIGVHWVNGLLDRIEKKYKIKF